MKKVYLIFANRKNQMAIQFILNNFHAVFEDYIDFQCAYVDEIIKKPDCKLKADAFILAHQSSYHTLRAHIDNFNSVIKLRRSANIRAKAILDELPKGSDVLVINDSYQTAVQTIYNFYENGISHLNFIPYNPELQDSGLYDSFEIALTPGEPQLVPGHIKKILDIGFREVDFYTMVELAQLLDLETERVNRNLFKHISEVLGATSTFIESYVYDYLKSDMLKHIIEKLDIAMLLLDNNFHAVYANKKARDIFDVSDKKEIAIASYIPKNILERDDIIKEPIIIGGKPYRYDKYTLSILDDTAGCYITLRENTSASPEKHALKKKGFVAKYQFKDITYRSKEMSDVIAISKRIALSDETVMIRGESGTGKELIAQSIHNYSERRSKPFVAINCAALPDSLLESELFGYEPGAFTGAKSKGKVGLFEQANHGTIFLDEIGDISLKLQAELLRTIQEMQVMRVGSDKLINIDVRIISATNRNIEQAIEAGTFREDLYYRINVLPINIPPLRKRKDDIDILLKDFLNNKYKNLTGQEKKILLDHDWPGNVRELENVSIYYSSLFRLPEYLTASGLKTVRHESLENQSKTIGSALKTKNLRFDTRALHMEILSIIYNHTEPAHGIGRTAIIQLLKEAGIGISDGKLRGVLSYLEKEEYVQIGRGRSGTRITKKAGDLLRSEGLI